MWIFLFLLYAHIYWLSTYWCNAPASQNLLILSTSVSVPNHCCIRYPCTVLCIIPTSKKKRQQHFPGVWVHCVHQNIRENVTGISQSQCTGRTTGRSARRCSALCGTQFCSRLSHGCCGIYTMAEIVVEFWAWICFRPSFRYLWPSIINIDSCV